jgi:peptidoglycan/LPS O-acetylase OafA/YrhL
MESVGYWFNYGPNIYWSLSVEEVFYPALPLVCALLRRNLLIALLCLVLIAVPPAHRAVHVDDELYFL